MNRIKFRNNLSNTLKLSRERAELSQKEMAQKLNVSERTIQNWESGYSEPLFSQLFEWFEVLDIQPQPYLLTLLYQNEFMKDEIEFTDSDVDNTLIALLPGMSMQTKRELLYLFYGSHGSSPTSVLNMVTAHLHTQLRHRINVSEQIITNYEIAESMNEIIEPDHVRPDMNKLKNATQKAKEAILHKKDSYNTI